MSNSSKQSNSWWESPLLWILVLIVGAAIAAIALSARDNSPTVSDRLETSSVQISGDGLPPYSAQNSATGLSVPTFAATTLDGDRVEVGGDGVARLYGFFAHWCPHCQNEVPMVVDWLDANALPPDTEIVAISTSVDPSAPNYPPSKWFTREKWSSTVILDSDSGELAQTFGLTSFPYWVVVDASGTVVAQASGEQDAAAFSALVAAAAS